MSGPLIKTADLLVTRAPEVLGVRMTPLAAEDTPRPSSSPSVAGTPFPDLLVALVRAEARQCNDVSRLLDAATLLCHLLTCPNPCQVGTAVGGTRGRPKGWGSTSLEKAISIGHDLLWLIVWGTTQGIR